MASKVNGYVGRINPGNGTNYALGSTAYGLCETAAATAAKTVDMTGFELVEGATVHVKFTYANTADSPTLSINSSTAKPIVGTWAAADICTLTYDGTSWVINNPTLSNKLNLPIKVGTGQGSLIENDLSLSLAAGTYAHSEGYWTSAAGDASHAEGLDANAFGAYSHAEGMHTVATHAAQHVFGRFNIGDASSADSSQIGNYIEIVGNGTDSANRSNARTLDWNGNEWLAGTLTLPTQVGADETHRKAVVVTTNVDTTETVQTNEWYRGYSFVDVDGEERAYFDLHSLNNGKQGVQLETRRLINNSPVYNNIRLDIDTDGTKSVTVADAAPWRSAINAVNKAGDTMTGNLVITTSSNSNLKLQNTAITVGTAPSDTTIIGSCHFRDSTDTTLGSLYHTYTTARSSNIALAARNYKNGPTGTLYQNYLILGMGNDGTPAVTVSDPLKWRSALETCRLIMVGSVAANTTKTLTFTNTVPCVLFVHSGGASTNNGMYSLCGRAAACTATTVKASGAITLSTSTSTKITITTSAAVYMYILAFANTDAITVS